MTCVTERGGRGEGGSLAVGARRARRALSLRTQTRGSTVGAVRAVLPVLTSAWEKRQH